MSLFVFKNKDGNVEEIYEITEQLDDDFILLINKECVNELKEYKKIYDDKKYGEIYCKFLTLRNDIVNLSNYFSSMSKNKNVFKKIVIENFKTAEMLDFALNNLQANAENIKAENIPYDINILNIIKEENRAFLNHKSKNIIEFALKKKDNNLINYMRKYCSDDVVNEVVSYNFFDLASEDFFENSENGSWLINKIDGDYFHNKAIIKMFVKNDSQQLKILKTIFKYDLHNKIGFFNNCDFICEAIAQEKNVNCANFLIFETNLINENNFKKYICNKDGNNLFKNICDKKELMEKLNANIPLSNNNQIKRKTNV